MKKKGYFMMEDGTKSSEHKPKKKRQKKERPASHDEAEDEVKTTKERKPIKIVQAKKVDPSSDVSEDEQPAPTTATAKPQKGAKVNAAKK